MNFKKVFFIFVCSIISITAKAQVKPERIVIKPESLPKPYSTDSSRNPPGIVKAPEGADGDAIDAFVGPYIESDKVFILNQMTRENKFDEHKILFGYLSKKDAQEGYLSNYPKNWKCGPIVSFTIEEFKKWLKKGDKTAPAK